MSWTTMNTAVSGLNANGVAMSVISNNIANVNTIGFKSSRPVFEDMLSQSMMDLSHSNQIGRGVRMAAVHRLFEQGTFETTGSGTDLAIDGDGFFVVSREGVIQYTRAGQFLINEEGLFANHDEYVLQGWSLDTNGNINSNLQNIDISSITAAPRETRTVEVNANLDANATVIGDTWEWNAVLQGGEVVGQANDFVAASGTLDFTDGRLQTETDTAAFSWGFVGTTSAQAIAFDFGESIDEGGSGLDGCSQFAGESVVKFLNQDGYGRGDLVSVQIDEDGMISGLFNNGRSRPVYQLALARFVSPWGLISDSGNLFSETTQSGPPLIGIPDTDGFGSVNSHSLELSNVDLASEFIQMIKTQQAFQANSRMITTADQMLQEVVNLRR